MPFVFHCIEREDGGVHFDFEVSNWGRVPSSGLLGDQRFDAWTTKIKEFVDRSRGITVGKALSDAVETLAHHRLVHDDLEWRHVALLPVVLCNDIIEMKSVLIDLTTVKAVETEDVARERMQRRKEELLLQLE